MERYSYLLKSRAKALGVFEKAKRGMRDVIEQIDRAKDHANVRIQSNTDLIEELKEKNTEDLKAIHFLECERADCLKVIDQIDKVIA